MPGCMVQRYNPQYCDNENNASKNGAEDIRKIIHEATLILKLRYNEDA